jgi:hypothetical protein
MALILAVLSTAFTVAMAMRFDWSGASAIFLGIAGWRIVFSMGLWFLVPPARRLGRLREEYPDLYLAQVLGGGRDRIVPASGIGRVSERHWRQDARARARAWWSIATITVVLVAGGAAYVFAVRPPTAEELIERFEIAWASSDVESVAELFGDETDTRARQLRAWMTREELEALPLIGFSTREDLGARQIRLTCWVELGKLELGLVRERDRWILNRLVFPPRPE